MPPTESMKNLDSISASKSKSNYQKDKKKKSEDKKDE